MNQSKLSEYDLLTRQPETMNVGQLNQAVKDLRELLHQFRVKCCEHETNQILYSSIK